MDELLKALAELQEQLKKTKDINSVMDIAREATEHIGPLIAKTESFMKEMDEIEFPKTLKTLTELIYSINRTIDQIQNGVNDNKSSLNGIAQKLDSLKELMVKSLAENHEKLEGRINKSETTLKDHSSHNKELLNKLILAQHQEVRDELKQFQLVMNKKFKLNTIINALILLSAISIIVILLMR